MNIARLIRASVVFLPFVLSAQAQSGFDVALIGDMPYGPASEPRFERVIADINQYNIEFTAHIGDTKSGSTRCDDSHYAKTLAYFNSFHKPVIYSVGDNEWTDCMRTNNGGYDPLGRLSLVRKTYFSSNQSLGRQTVALLRQSDDPKYALYVENAMLVKQPVVFVSIHMPGSNNNLEYKTVQGAPNPFYDGDKEYAARNAANIAWLRTAFETARKTNALGIMILTQANVFETFMDTGTGATHSGFADFVTTLREETGKYSGEVVMVSGDSHYMRVDKPLTNLYPACVSTTGDCTPFDAALDARGTRVQNFTRLEVPGSGDVHWALAHIRPDSRNLFQFEFMMMPSSGSGPTGVTASVSAPGTLLGPNSYETSSPQITLDASKSVSTNTGALSYSWVSAAGYPVPAMTGASTAAPVIQFPSKGTYQLRLTVTDRTGATSTVVVTLRYV
jgi:hypothetical protein